MNETFLPIVGQLLYSEELGSGNELQSASLLYVDTEPEPGKQWMLTWVAQMSDFKGKGMEVYAEPEVGGGGVKYVKRVATDQDILLFINTIKRSDDADEQFKKWMKLLDEDEDWGPLLIEEKDRLKRLMRQE
jgi:hypothetical protein